MSRERDQRQTVTARLAQRYPALRSCLREIDAAIDILGGAFAAKKKLLICGNGGSAADSEHIVGELMKGFLKPRRIPRDEMRRFASVSGETGLDIGRRLQGALPAIALTSQVSLNSAISNDTDSDMIFAQQVYGLGKDGDVVLGISTSGNSQNVVNALVVARALNLRTIALTGATGGNLLPLADLTIRVPADKVAEIQELHLPVYHAMCIALEERFFPE